MPEETKIPTPKGVKLWISIFLIVLIAFPAINFFYNRSAGNPITIGTLFYPAYLDNMFSGISSSGGTYTQLTRPTSPTPATTPETTQINAKKGNIVTRNPIWTTLLVLLVIYLLYRSRGLIFKGRESPTQTETPPAQETPTEPETTTQEPETPARRTYNHLQDIIEGKTELIDKIEDIELKKQKILEDIDKIKEEISSMDPDEEIPKLMDRTSDEYKKLLREKKELEKLVRYEEAIEGLLKQLLEIEIYVYRMMEELEKNTQNQQALELIEKIKKITETMEPHLKSYFKIQLAEIRDEEKLEELLSKRHIGDRVKKEWNSILKAKQEEVESLFEEEKKLFTKIKGWIENEIDSINQLTALISKESETEQPPTEKPPEPPPKEKSPESPLKEQPTEPQSEDQPPTEQPKGPERTQELAAPQEQDLELIKWMQKADRAIRQTDNHLESLLAEEEKDLKKVLKLCDYLLGLINIYTHEKNTNTESKEKILKKIIEILYYLSSFLADLDRISKPIREYEAGIVNLNKQVRKKTRGLERTTPKFISETSADREVITLFQDFNRVIQRYQRYKQDIENVLQQTEEARNTFDYNQEYLLKTLNNWINSLRSNIVQRGSEERPEINISRVTPESMDRFVEQALPYITLLRDNTRSQIRIKARIGKKINETTLPKMHRLFERFIELLEAFNKKVKTNS